MGRDKALLPYRGAPLWQAVAAAVESAAGSATLIGDPARYTSSAYHAIPDRYPGEGPLGGILTALHHTEADWNLIVACDMPELSPGFLTQLLVAAETAGAEALVPVGPGGRPEPLCAVYHRRALAAIETAFGAGTRKVTTALEGRAVLYPVSEVTHFQNVNTPEDWAAYAAD
jgi:molybdopterin-guanine dinucleotide biosynthesis protein A